MARAFVQVAGKQIIIETGRVGRQVIIAIVIITIIIIMHIVNGGMNGKSSIMYKGI